MNIKLYVCLGLLLGVCSCFAGVSVVFPWRAAGVSIDIQIDLDWADHMQRVSFGELMRKAREDDKPYRMVVLHGYDAHDQVFYAPADYQAVYEHIIQSEQPLMDVVDVRVYLLTPRSADASVVAVFDQEATKKLLGVQDHALERSDLFDYPAAGAPSFYERIKQGKLYDRETRCFDLGNRQLRRVPIVFFGWLMRHCPGVQELNLADNELSSLSAALSCVGSLRRVVLSNNRFSVMPHVLSQLPHLEELYIENNQLHELPEWVSECGALTSLILDNNEIVEIPVSLCLLLHLEVFSLAHNRMTRLPQEIRYLSQLKTLDLDYNQLVVLPDEIGELTALEMLSLDHNRIRMLPESIGGLVNLKTLNIAHNTLERLPKAIGRLSNLHSLIVSYNQIHELPDSFVDLVEVQQVDLSGNYFEELPRTIYGLPESCIVSLCGNAHPGIVSPLCRSELLKRGIIVFV